MTNSAKAATLAAQLDAILTSKNSALAFLQVRGIQILPLQNPSTLVVEELANDFSCVGVVVPAERA